MITVFYSSIRPAIGQRQDQVIREARKRGYELVQFAGWDDADLGYAGNRGPRWQEAQQNRAHINAIQDFCVVHSAEGDDWPHIMQTAPVRRSCPMEDEEALAIVRGDLGETGADL